MYVIRLQRKGQIPIKLNFTRIGSETVKTVETKNLSQGAKKSSIAQFFKTNGTYHSDYNFERKQRYFKMNKYTSRAKKKLKKCEAQKSKYFSNIMTDIRFQQKEIE